MREEMWKGTDNHQEHLDEQNGYLIQLKHPKIYTYTKVI